MAMGKDASAMMIYDPALTVREARARYFAANGFGDGGYDANWVRLQAGPVPLFFPNTAARVRAVRFHDIHHVATEYETSWTGEAEIAAWEIASSCADHYAAWLLNLLGLAIGLVIAPRRVWQAFLRGRHSSNLYRREFGDALLTSTVGTLRHDLSLDQPLPAASIRDVATFAAWSVLAVLTFLVHVALSLAPLGIVIILLWRLV
jgi:hypothetical protein